MRLKELFFPQVAVKALVPVAPEKSERELDLDSLAISFGLDFASDGKTASAGLKIASKDAPADSLSQGALYQIQIDAFANFDVIGPEHQLVARDEGVGWNFLKCGDESLAEAHIGFRKLEL